MPITMRRMLSQTPGYTSAFMASSEQPKSTNQNQCDPTVPTNSKKNPLLSLPHNPFFFSSEKITILILKYSTKTFVVVLR